MTVAQVVVTLMPLWLQVVILLGGIAAWLYFLVMVAYSFRYHPEKRWLSWIGVALLILTPLLFYMSVTYHASVVLLH